MIWPMKTDPVLRSAVKTEYLMVLIQFQTTRSPNMNHLYLVQLHLHISMTHSRGFLFNFHRWQSFVMLKRAPKQMRDHV